jgi:hypothetical protein
MFNDAARRALGLALALALSACAGPKRGASLPPVPPEPAPVLVEPPRPEIRTEPPPTPIVPPEAAPTDVERLLVQFENVRRMPGAEAARELEQARQAFNRARSEYNRVQFALLSLLPNTGGRDEARALSLLEPLVRDGSKDKSGGGMRALAALVYYQTTEERKMDERMKDEQKRADSLQQKLDALKQVEKSLLDREQSQIRPK